MAYASTHELFFVKIPSSQTLNDTDGKKYTSFEVAVQGPFSSWTIHRRYKQFSALNEEMVVLVPSLNLITSSFPKKKMIGSFQQTFVEERREALEAYLQELLLLPQALSYAPLAEFLDEASVLTLQMHMWLMKEQLQECRSLNSTLQNQLQNAKQEASQSAAVIDGLERQLRTLRLGAGIDTSNEIMLPGVATLGVAAEMSTGGNQMVFKGNIFEDLDHNAPHPILSSTLQTFPRSAVSPSVYISENNRDGKDVRNRSLNNYYDTDRDLNTLDFTPKPGYFIKQVLGLDKDFFSYAEALESESDRQISDSSLTTAESRDKTSGMFGGLETGSGRNSVDLGSSILDTFPSELLDFTQNVSKWDLLTDEVVTMVQPQELQIQYRVSASRYVAKHTRKILGTQVYEIGMQGLRCFLPDDPIRLSVFLSRGTEAGWYVRLNEQMCRLSLAGAQPEEVIDPVGNSGNSGAVHSLSNVSFVSNNEAAGSVGHKLQCLVDSVLGVEVLDNARLELCLMAFMEDFDRLFGKNHLFKRSLILIRAWWVYEANLSSSCGISDSALCVMILSIMNRFHAKIHHPFHALCLFLAEFCAINFSTHVITIEGPIPCEHFMAASPSLANASPSVPNLISADFLNRYRKLTLAIDEDESSTMELLNESIGDSTLSDAVFVANRISNKSNYGQTVCAFSVKPIMIAHPLLPGMIFVGPAHNMRRKTTAIVDEIWAGSRALIPILRSRVTDAGTVSSHEMIEAFFKNITARFGRGWRPDIPAGLAWAGPPQWLANSRVGSMSNERRADSRGLSVDSSRSSVVSTDTARSRFSQSDFDTRDLYWISLDKVWERIRYCNLVLESQVSDSALRTLSRQVLEEKGPLPVGEIGKMLQEACAGIPNMSAVLKERFGGLKKFLESYPDDFVLATDHPFNPSVYLQDSLSADELGMIMRGEPLVKASQSNAKAKKTARANNHVNTNRVLLNRKKSPSPALQASPEAYYNTSAAQSGFYRSPSFESLNRQSAMNTPNSHRYAGAGLSQRQLSLTSSMDSGIMRLGSAERDPRLPPYNAGLYTASMFGQIGIDPMAPEFLPKSEKLM